VAAGVTFVPCQVFNNAAKEYSEEGEKGGGGKKGAILPDEELLIALIETSDVRFFLIHS